MKLYLVTALLWAIYAMKQQKELYGKNILMVGIINFLICPIAIVFAIVRKEK